MNLAALLVTRATHEPKMPFARHQRNSCWSTLVVVISGDGELFTSAAVFCWWNVACAYGLLEQNAYTGLNYVRYSKYLILVCLSGAHCFQYKIRGIDIRDAFVTIAGLTACLTFSTVFHETISTGYLKTKMVSILHFDGEENIYLIDCY